MEILKYTFFVFLTFQISYGQSKETIPKGFTKVEGLEYSGHITFYFEKKTQTILAFQNKKAKWNATVMKTCGKPSVGKSEIREIRIEKEHLKIVYGKHSFAKILIETGKIICEGSD
ncbi:hypothetical protein CJ739_3673 [Mariniflexile rhizosphaerae]|uniref:hypothetical protein n=1 Tax=unclassified Mariniflexile TaxID=2643887 RepID=UPI000E32E722|nr:hypothetical protein [Mariniflexile sp. TRM1-10]AXP82734.1 hypothetical protein CJ739_3673 [Mariniflexile sp. TRM1-10]